MLRRLYAWTLARAESPHALLVLIAVSFAESSFFPVPPDILLIPMVLAQRKRALVLAAWCTAASVAGGIVGYGIGSLLYESVGKWIINLYGYGNGVESFRQTYAEWGVWIILLEGADADPLQARHHRQRLLGLQFRPVRALVDHHPRHKILRVRQLSWPIMASRSAISWRSAWRRSCWASLRSLFRASWS